jgi:quercetin dioxygenase-like cupin family protein
MQIEPHVVDEHTCPPDGWDGYRWKTLISSDRTPTAHITQGIAELLPTLPDMRQLHRHAHAETYYVVSGHGILWIGEDQHTLAPGVTAFIPGNVNHTAIATGTEPLRILYVFAADSFSDVTYEYPGMSPA